MLTMIKNNVSLIAGISLLILVVTNSLLKNDVAVICINLILVSINLILYFISRGFKKVN
ncbi:hypothetical protein SAMN04488168_12047 [Bacillus sp. 491mf]|nr:hypothetical protein SAMN04488168_12047 [Bacillus sp. 491mf]